MAGLGALSTCLHGIHMSLVYCQVFGSRLLLLLSSLQVCVVELWPEGRKCGRDAHMMQGILLGAAAMAWTLYIGV